MPIYVTVPVKWNAVAHLQCGQRLATFWIPQFDRLLIVFAAGHNERLVRMPMNALHIGTVAPEHTFLLASQKIEHTKRTIIAAGREFIIGRTETAQRKWSTVDADYWMLKLFT